MNILITICGRAGSKGVTNKNFRPLKGIPLIFYTLAAAFQYRSQSDHHVDVCVSSDSEELLALVRAMELTCVVRPLALSLDNTPKIPAIIHAVETTEHVCRTQYDYVIDLDITSPLRTPHDIENALEKIICDSQADVVFSVVHSRRNPYFNMVEVWNGVTKKVLEGSYSSRQEVPEVFDMNASIYCYKRAQLGDRIARSPFDGEFEIFLMKDRAVLDIDNEDDFKYMEVLSEYFFAGELQELFRSAQALLKESVST